MSRSRRYTANLLFLFWVWGVAHLAHSATFKEEMLSYDVESLMWAALMALFGGTLRTIFTLAAEKRVLSSLLYETWKDGLVAIVAGALMYITIEALRATGWIPVPSEVRFAAIVFAGWSRLSFFGWLHNLGVNVTTGINDVVFARIKALGGTKPPPPVAPPSVMPADTKPAPFHEVK